MAVLGSREQFCIHHTVSQSNQKNEDCKKATKHRRCAHHNNFNALKHVVPVVWDVEVCFYVFLEN